jgi:phage virion morphogenesis protein
MIVIGYKQLEALHARVREAQDADLHDLLDSIGQTMEDHAKRRIAESKRSPAGKRWAPWSQRYAKTRHGGHSLLRSEGHLLDSITHQIEGKEVVVGSNLVYAATHQWGDDERKIPARSYLSEAFEDETEREDVRDVLRVFLSEIL